MHLSCLDVIVIQVFVEDELICNFMAELINSYEFWPIDPGLEVIFDVWQVLKKLHNFATFEFLVDFVVALLHN